MFLRFRTYLERGAPPRIVAAAFVAGYGVEGRDVVSPAQLLTTEDPRVAVQMADVLTAEREIVALADAVVRARDFPSANAIGVLVTAAQHEFRQLVEASAPSDAVRRAWSARDQLQHEARRAFVDPRGRELLAALDTAAKELALSVACFEAIVPAAAETRALSTAVAALGVALTTSVVVPAVGNLAVAPEEQAREMRPLRCDVFRVQAAVRALAPAVRAFEPRLERAFRAYAARDGPPAALERALDAARASGALSTTNMRIAGLWARAPQLYREYYGVWMLLAYETYNAQSPGTVAANTVAATTGGLMAAPSRVSGVATVDRAKDDAKALDRELTALWAETATLAQRSDAPEDDTALVRRLVRQWQAFMGDVLLPDDLRARHGVVTPPTAKVRDYRDARRFYTFYTTVFPTQPAILRAQFNEIFHLSATKDLLYTVKTKPA